MAHNWIVSGNHYIDPSEVAALRIIGDDDDDFHDRGKIHVYLRGNPRPLRLTWNDEQRERFGGLLRDYANY